jgi:serine/threonine protein kinase
MSDNSEANGSEANGLDPLWTAIRSRHPDIADEIQDAINTLRKLQGIAGPGVPGQESADELIDPSLAATSDGTFMAPARPGRGPGPIDIVATTGHQGVARDVPVLKPGEAFGRYQIVRLLGRGAMGAVYLAYDSQLQRHIALKTPSLEENRPTIERFFREARTAAQLRSPYVCPVYDVGRHGSVYYLSMAFIDGEPLTRMIAMNRLKEGKVIAALVSKIARGVGKAHEAGIIHRDLKPDNIMIDKDGEPVVMDFGLARRMDDDIQLTTPGRILGTPAYMSPEQVEGDPKKIGPPTDIYSLGVILYQVLTGRLPFRGSLTSVLRQIGSETPARPSTIIPELAESALEVICLKMMAKCPMERPVSMSEVAVELEKAFTQQQAAPVCKQSVWQRLCSWVRPRPATPPAPAAAPDAAPDGAAAPAPPPPAPPPGVSLLEQTSADLSQMPRDSSS